MVEDASTGAAAPTAPLVITAEITAALRALAELAEQHPVDMTKLARTIRTPHGEQKHRAQMTEQSLVIPGPWNFFVTFSIETGHPAGTCRHMSMSIMRLGRVPSPDGVWMVAEILGFRGRLSTCVVWQEELRDGGVAVNLVQQRDLH